MSGFFLEGKNLFYHTLLEYPVNDYTPEEKKNLLLKSFQNVGLMDESLQLLINYLTFISEFCGIDPQIASKSFKILRNQLQPNYIQLMALCLIAERTQSTKIKNSQIRFIKEVSNNLLFKYFDGSYDDLVTIYVHKTDVPSQNTEENENTEEKQINEISNKDMLEIKINRQNVAYLFHIFTSFIKYYEIMYYRIVDEFTFPNHIFQFYPSVEVIRPKASDFQLLCQVIPKNCFLKMENFLYNRSLSFGIDAFHDVYKRLNLSPSILLNFQRQANSHSPISSRKPNQSNLTKTNNISIQKPQLGNVKFIGNSKLNKRAVTIKSHTNIKLNASLKGGKNNDDPFHDLTYWNKLLPNADIKCSGNPYQFYGAVCKAFYYPQISIDFILSTILVPHAITSDIEAIVNQTLKFSSVTDLLLFKTQNIEQKMFITLVSFYVIKKAKLNEIKSLFSRDLFIAFAVLVAKVTKKLNLELKESLKLIMNQNNFSNNSYFVNICLLELYSMKYIKISPDDELILYACPKFAKSDNSQITLAYIKLELMKSLHNNSYFNKNIIDIISKTQYIVNLKEFIVRIIKRSSINSRFIIWASLHKKFTFDTYLISKELQAYFAFKQNKNWKDEKGFDYLNALVSEPLMTKEKIERKNTLFKKYKTQLYRLVNSDLDKYSCFLPVFVDLLSFDERQKDLPKVKSDSIAMLQIHRENIILDSMKAFEENSFSFSSPIKCSYEGEKGLDMGGVIRDWFDSLWKALENTVFSPTPGGRTLMFKTSFKDPKIISFAGSFIAGSIVQQQKIGARLASFILKPIVGIEPCLEDVKEYDKEVWNTLHWVLNNNVKYSYLNFMYGEDELIQNGSEIDVTEQNKGHYVNLVIEYLLQKKHSYQLQYFLEGFYKVIEKNKLLFTINELNSLIFGENRISAGEWKAYTKEIEISLPDNLNMLFEIIGKWDDKTKRKLLRFVTGSSQVPVGGFKQLRSYGGLFSINWNSNFDRLPIAHTCTNLLDIPAYPTKEIMEKKLLIAIECNDFAFL
ncbi:hypothetical protein TRFO_29648 [Tritrichomonas foetus]|uniref:HECT-type E3 ubiquitin transferase n=1 Tax=Tritrichomonas foetus TaxID=1144522 RepID=A0A1J4K0L7_9EUKA|nr:hypothetical protein TRFO_29648 [Tritrichomonas foetus]|eukprot:OHT03037.1 hypothetical protein TRFO_29648 [Tritrichomonas foetus]